MSEIPKRYTPGEQEPKWQQFWEDNAIFKFDPDSDKEVYSIDTPPPTVSGKMHVGHSFSYTHTDFMARFHRMRGKSVFYPFGTDDNGLPTERLVEKMKGVKGSKMDRQEFIDLCLKTLDEELRPKYLEDWKRIGVSCDWDIFYSTISKEAMKISQAAFLDLVEKDRVERKFSPTMVCPQCHTAVAQAELEDLERDGILNHIQVEVEGGDKVTFATTRPELAPACIAITVHPDDERYKHLVGKKATLPGLNITVPILADDLTKMDFGSGVVYWCPYGDINDIEFVTKHPELSVKHIMNPDGKLNDEAGEFSGMTSKEAREAVLEKWKAAGAVVKQETTKQVVNVHERCGTPIEFVATNQWFIKYLDLREKFLERGEELQWHPSHMKHRYDNWVKGLKWDWCISRQRFSGIPIPVWYDKKTEKPIFAKVEDLPVDPLKDLPQGYSADDVIGEKDVMDTWATSSLTPHLAADRFKGHVVYDKIIPMSIRPQAHDIISFWLFNTLARSQLHHDRLPWKDAMISGWVLDPKGRKMSKSKGNVVEPQEMIKKYSADCLRFWSSSSKLGDDIPFQEKEFVTGQKVVNKLWNASKFVHMHLEDYDGSKPEKLEAIDQWILARLNVVIDEATNDFESYAYHRVRSQVDQFFMSDFADNYMEIVKGRLYNPDIYGAEARKSGQYTAKTVIETVLKLFAPLLPYITESVYQYMYKAEGKSVHQLAWPVAIDGVEASHLECGAIAVDVVGGIRRFKAGQQKSLGAAMDEVVITCDDKFKEALEPYLADLKGAAKAEEITFGEGGTEQAREGVLVSGTFTEKKE